MKLILAVLLALNMAGASQPPASRVDGDSLLYSMPTISDELPAMDPGPVRPTASDFLLHEDEWRQIEFFPPGRVEEVQRMLSAIKQFAAANRVRSGWQDIFGRQVPHGLVLAGADAPAVVARALGATVGPAPVIERGDATPVGRVAGGFTIRLAAGVTLYGIADASGIRMLAANLGQGAEATRLTTAFMQLNTSHALVLVDWRAQMLLLRAVDEGNIEVWEP